MKKIDVLEIAKRIEKPWSPVIITQIENYVIREAKFEGKYREKPHKHDEFDEFFLVIDRNIQITVEGKQYNLGPNQGLLVPKGKFHNPFAEKAAVVLLFEHKNI